MNVKYIRKMLTCQRLVKLKIWHLAMFLPTMASILLAFPYSNHLDL